MLKQHNRYPYSSLPSRAQYEWPDGKKLAVYVAMNIEAFSYGEGKGAAIAPPNKLEAIVFSHGEITETGLAFGD